jgi:phage terminase large subunit-like protein
MPSRRPAKPKAKPPNTSPPDPVTAWARAVVSGEVVQGPYVRAACQRHLRDLIEGPKRGLTWNIAQANHVIEFFPKVLRLAGGQFEGLPFELHPSQKFLTGSLFGWKRADGTRRFRRAYIEEGKGSGKTPWAAGVGLYCMVSDGEPRAEVYAAASDKDQAMVLFRDAVAMRDQSPELFKRLTPSGGNPVWNLADMRTGSFFRPISKEKRKSGSGPRPSCALCDEVHEHHDGLIIETLERGFKWRRQPLLIMITNAGSDRNSVAWAERSHAVKVAQGLADDDETLSFVCALDVKDDPLEDPSCWIKANPLLGVTIKEDYLAGVVRQAKQIPGKLNGILRLHFCVWTDAEKAWMTGAAIDAVIADFDPYEELAGEEVSVGLDLSASQDMTAEAFVVHTGYKEVERTTPGGVVVKVSAPTYDAWIEAWTPGDTLPERALRDQARYDEWVRDGYLRAPAGKIVRLDYPAAHLADVAALFHVKHVAYDRYAFRKFEDECAAMGLTLPFIEHPQGGKKRGAVPEETALAAKRARIEPPQGLWMPGSLMELESAILEQRIRLRRNPVLISACASAAIEEDPWGNRWLSKRRATNRIDAVVALCMALGAAAMKTEKGESVYDVEARGGVSMKSSVYDHEARP